MEKVVNLAGKYIVALHDKKTEKIYVIRDPLGSVDAYMDLSCGIAISSNISVLLQSANYNIRPNIEELRKILIYRSPGLVHTCFSGIDRVPTGNILEYNIRNGRLSFTPFAEVRKLNPTLDDLDLALKASVERSLGAQNGLLLSSGLDSTLVLSYLLETDSPRAYSVRFGHDSDENMWAEKIAECLGVPFDTLDITTTLLHESLLPLNRSLEEPCGNPARVAIYVVSSLIRGCCDTLFLGEEADELFLGYPKYIEAFRRFDDFNPSSFFSKRMPFDLEMLIVWD